MADIASLLSPAMNSLFSDIIRVFCAGNPLPDPRNVPLYRNIDNKNWQYNRGGEEGVCRSPQLIIFVRK